MDKEALSWRKGRTGMEFGKGENRNRLGRPVEWER
jgi:hypothetical protein